VRQRELSACLANSAIAVYADFAIGGLVRLDRDGRRTIRLRSPNTWFPAKFGASPGIYADTPSFGLRHQDECLTILGMPILTIGIGSPNSVTLPNLPARFDGALSRLTVPAMVPFRAGTMEKVNTVNIRIGIIRVENHSYRE
jgi:hypothetical protein